jgi:hypothetical protein
MMGWVLARGHGVGDNANRLSQGLYPDLYFTLCNLTHKSLRTKILDFLAEQGA